MSFILRIWGGILSLFGLTVRDFTATSVGGLVADRREPLVVRHAGEVDVAATADRVSSLTDALVNDHERPLDRYKATMELSGFCVTNYNGHKVLSRADCRLNLVPILAALNRYYSSSECPTRRDVALRLETQQRTGHLSIPEEAYCHYPALLDWAYCVSCLMWVSQDSDYVAVQCRQYLMDRLNPTQTLDEPPSARTAKESGAATCVDSVREDGSGQCGDGESDGARQGTPGEQTMPSAEGSEDVGVGSVTDDHGVVPTPVERGVEQEAGRGADAVSSAEAPTSPDDDGSGTCAARRRLLQWRNSLRSFAQSRLEHRGKQADGQITMECAVQPEDILLPDGSIVTQGLTDAQLSVVTGRDWYTEAYERLNREIDCVSAPAVGTREQGAMTLEEVMSAMELDTDAKPVRPGPPVDIVGCVDAEYGTDVPALPKPPMAGTIVQKNLSRNKFFRATKHYTLLDLDLRHTLVFYDRNSPHNAYCAFRYRLARFVAPWQPSDRAFELFNTYTGALPELLGFVGTGYNGNIVDVVAWLRGRNYNRARRRTLVRELFKLEGAIDDAGYLQPGTIMDASQITVFQKNEPFSRCDGKAPRAISSRDDPAKMLLGPLFQPLDDALFTSRFSVKHLALDDRKAELVRRLGDGPVAVIDYSSYESCQRSPMQLLGEMVVYARTLADQGNAEFVRSCLLGLARPTSAKWERGVVSYKDALVRYSGEVTTSLGNTINNLLCLAAAYTLASHHAASDVRDTSSLPSWVDQLQAAPLDTIPMVVEGDDAVVAIPQFVLGDQRCWLDSFKATLEGFGLAVKLDVYSHVSEAGFCSLSWNQATGTTMPRDLVRAVAKACWASAPNNHRQLLALKGESLWQMYRRTPVLGAFAASLTRTTDVGAVRLSTYERQEYADMGLHVAATSGSTYRLTLTKRPVLDVLESDREYFAEMWGIAPEQQVAIEKSCAKRNYRTLDQALTLLDRSK